MVKLTIARYGHTDTRDQCCTLAHFLLFFFFFVLLFPRLTAKQTRKFHFQKYSNISERKFRAMAAEITTKERLQRLMAAKAQLEAQISQHGQILAANDNVGMSGPLVDLEGFPRNDIDIYQVRQARQSIICLQNDHKELMNQIQTQLNLYHSEIATTDPELVNRASALDLDSDRNTGGANISNFATARPFVVVNLVSPNSPAEEAGLCVGDAILRFGSVNSNNFKGDLGQIGEIVRNTQNQNVQLKVKRGEQQLDLILVPKIWSGRGLLGCNIVLPPEAMEH